MKWKFIFIFIGGLLNFQSSAFSRDSSDSSRVQIQKEEDHFIVRKRNWVLKSWTSRSQTKSFIKQIDALEANLRVIFQLGQKPIPLFNVLILKDEKTFLNYSKDNLGEVFYTHGYWSGAKSEIVTWDHHKLEETLKILSHELTHYFTYHAFGKVPLWLSEGLAEYMSFSKERWGKLKEPYPNKDRLKVIFEAEHHKVLIPLDQLIGLEKYLEGRGLHLQYAQEWGLVYFLFHGSKGKYKKDFVNYLMELKKNPQARFQDFIDLKEIESVWIKELLDLKVGGVKVTRSIVLGEGDD